LAAHTAFCFTEILNKWAAQGESTMQIGTILCIENRERAFSLARSTTFRLS
jgi:hypothetical protein